MIASTRVGVPIRSNSLGRTDPSYHSISYRIVVLQLLNHRDSATKALTPRAVLPVSIRRNGATIHLSLSVCRRTRVPLLVRSAAPNCSCELSFIRSILRFRFGLIPHWNRTARSGSSCVGQFSERTLRGMSWYLYGNVPLKRRARTGCLLLVVAGACHARVVPMRSRTLPLLATLRRRSKAALDCAPDGLQTGRRQGSGGHRG